MTPLLVSLTNTSGGYTLTDSSGERLDLPAPVAVHLDPTPPAQPLPRLLALSFVTERETENGTERTRHTFQIDRISAAGREVLDALNLSRLSAATVERVSKRKDGLAFRYSVAGECLEWPISTPPVHMVCGRSDGLLWLRIFYLDALDAPHGPNLSTPAPCADFLLSPKQYLSAAPLLCGLAS